MGCVFSEIRKPGMVGQKQVPVFSHVETTGGVGQVNIPVGESEQRQEGLVITTAVQFSPLLLYLHSCSSLLGFRKRDGQHCVYALRIVQR